MGRFPAMSALIVDREALLSLELSQALQDSGCDQIHVCKSARQARRLVETGLSIDLAVLELVAGTQSAMPLAQALVRRGTRVVLTSATSDGAARMPPLAAMPIVSKPYLLAEVLDGLAAPQSVTA